MLPRVGAAPPLAPARPARGASASSGCGSPRSSPTRRAPSPAYRRARPSVSLGHALGQRAAHAPRRGRSGRADRVGTRARVRRRVRRGRADVLDRDVARRAHRRVRAERRVVHRHRRDGQRRLGRADRAVRARRARLSARARAARPRRPGARGSTRTEPRELAARRRRRASSARSRSRPRSIAGPSVPGAGGSPLLDYQAPRRGNGEGNLLSAPPPILQHPGQAHARPGAGAVHRQVAARRVLAGHRARLVHRRQRVGRQQGDRAARVEAHGARRPAALDAAAPAVPHRGCSTRTGCRPRTSRSRINLTAARVVPESLTLLVDSKAQHATICSTTSSRRSRRRRIAAADARAARPTPG